MLTGTFETTINLGGGALSGNADASTIYLAKFHSNGTHLWSKRFAGIDSAFVHSIAVSSDGQIAIVGSYHEQLDLGGGPLAEVTGFNNLFVAKLAADGSHLFSFGAGDGVGQVAIDVAFDVAGNVVFAANFEGTVEVDGSPWTTAGQRDVLLAKLTPSGSLVWGKSFGDAQLQWAESCAVAPNSSIWLAGYFDGSINFGGGPLNAAGGGDLFVAHFAP